MWLNEHDAYAADWLRNLWPKAAVDERSIRDVQAADVIGRLRCHFFGGIGGWEFALQLAGWPDAWPVWTGSCPCQPFSEAGKRKGEADDRHLWPEFFRLIRECRPATVFGEQVAGKGGLRWLDGVCDDLEGEGYAVGTADLCAASAGTEAEGWIVRGDSGDWERIIVGSPHIRQRLFWVAHAGDTERGSRSESEWQHRGALHAANGGLAKRLGHTSDARPQERIGDGRIQREAGRAHEGQAAELRSGTSGLGNADGRGLGQHLQPDGDSAPHPADWHPPWADANRPSQTFWDAFDLIPCRDDKVRRVERGSFPLVAGIPRDLGRGEPRLQRMAKRARSNRVGRLRGYGNAIVPQVAAMFIRAFLEAKGSK